MVKKRRYITEEELIQLTSLCNILPGPTSTQTITAIGFKIGGANLAYLTLLVWILPATTLMTMAAITFSILQEHNIPLNFAKFIQPMAVGFVSYAAYKISSKVVNTKSGISIMVFSAIISYFLKSPYLFPLILILSGAVTAYKFKYLTSEEKPPLKIEWSNFFLWAGVFLFAAFLGAITKALPIRIFENFYRNGSLIFGGGQVLIPLLYTEFVDFKSYLTSQEFLTGYALSQSIPGPTFAFSAFIGALTMKSHGISGQVTGAISASIGIFLPGTFLIFFIIRFWERLRKYRIVKASLEGVNACSTGMVIAAAVLLFQPLETDWFNISIVVLTFLLLLWEKVPPPLIIASGLALGLIF
jgi:chromate transporter